ncbi:DHH family phosphoesterase [bacterium]|nr:DHH family phosphoesterase [bacterium]
MRKRIIKRYLSLLKTTVQDRKNGLIVTHTNPDPDALSTAMALSHLLRERHGITCSIAHAGSIGRAENLAMVRLLGIRLKQFNRVKLAAYDLLALVDGQPKAGNTPDLPYDIVIDHHPRRKDTVAPLTIINPEIGVSATILVNMLLVAGLEIPAALATALSYGISSETENLGREVHPADLRAYLEVYARANLRTLSKILHPSRENVYYQTLHSALERAMAYKHVIYSDLGQVPTPEMVAEMADLLLKHKRISWVLCLGRYRSSAIISLRTSNNEANAGALIKKMVADPDWVGGHDTMAGGAIPLGKGQEQGDYDSLSGSIVRSFAKLQHLDPDGWHPLLAREEIPIR